MRAASKNRGYTIVEVMIFLAVSGLMFAMAATFVSGKQAASEFNQSMNGINATVQAVINDVSNGFYPSTGNFSCRAATSGPPIVENPSATQGGNKGCVFLGKVMQFWPSDPLAGTEPASAYNVFTIVGRQFAPGPVKDLPVKDFTQAQPIAVNPPSAPISLTQRSKIEWGARVVRMFATNASGTQQNIGTVGFYGSFNQSAGSSLESGSQSVLSIPVPGVVLNQPSGTVVNNVSAQASAMNGSINASPNVTICFNGGRGKFGSLKIGSANGQRLTTNMKIGNSLVAVEC